MPPKKEERRPLEPIFSQTTFPFYQYQTYQQDNLDQVSQFLTYFKPELLQMMKNNIQDNMQILCQSIGITLHPTFVKVIQSLDINDFDENKKFKNPEEYENDQTSQVVFFNSVKVDIITLKLLEFCSYQSGVQTLKFCNNDLGQAEYQIISQLISNAECKIKKLYIDWQQIQPQLFQSNHLLEQLYLRSCQIKLPFIEILCQNMRNLKVLDLYDNQLSKEAFNLIGTALKENTFLEQLGLAKNQINSLDQLSEIMQNVGKFLMSQDEYDDYRIKEKERDQIIERNKKVKKKGTEEVVPVLETIQQFDNNWYIMRNQKLQLLNLSLNQIDENSFVQIEKFLNQTIEGFQLVLTNNKFEDQKALQRLKKKYNKKLMI
ncbi:unnamed protein product [Paramecium primaurelia]|uniref:Leucine rich repeat protein n=2 Tax=Paramecium TaxID=5884 RepID=A0A8S1UIE0_9CILI|nr:unnamed protein product [Paramecium primaurelia]CAD8164951.1 unnamed protein product [Paramecium pentaurelia]